MYQYDQLSSSDLPDADTTRDYVREQTSTRPATRLLHKHACSFLLLLSLLANMTFIFLLTGSSHHNSKECGHSKFAGLTRTIPKPWATNHAGNETSWNELWNQQTSYDAGVIALDDSYAKSMDLPRSQRWPWDANKGIYLLNAYHNLHCVKNIRSSLDEFRLDLPQSVPWGHVQHCLLVLRSEIMCNADDTPRYSGYQPPQSSGLGQVRMCKDWSALEKWATGIERAGCWRHIPGEEGVEGFSNLDRYRFCPKGSPYEEAAKTEWLSGE